LADATSALDAVERLSIESFDLDMLDQPDATLFVLSPNTGTAAGAAVALIDSIIRRFRKKTANHQLDHRLLLELDEVANSAPLPNLLTMIGESAGLGCNILATVQATSHLDVVWGPTYAAALRDIFPGTLIMYGAKEKYLLEQASHWAGLATRRTDTYEPGSGARAQASLYGQTIDWQELLPQSREEAQLLRIDPTGRQRGSANELVHIPDWTEFIKIFDQAIHRRLEKANR
jgi:type IV secretory pathway TraG/TraD family ATPase VirD4